MECCADARASACGRAFNHVHQVFALIALSLWWGTSASAQIAQPQLTRAQIVARVCRAPELAGGPAVDAIRRIEQRFGPVVNQVQGHRIHVAVVDSDVINAWNQNFSMSESLICVPRVMASFMSAEGELAFIFAHEIGHALDDPCKTASGRAHVATSTSPLAAVLGALLDQSSPVTEQRGCEARADEIGLNVLTRAGYNPYDAAGAFGRLEMYLGDTSTGLLARLAAMNGDHPMTPDRIRHMRTLLTRTRANAQ